MLGARDDLVEIATANSAVLFELRRRRADLEHQVARLVPGVHRLHFVAAEAPPPAPRHERE